MDGATKTLVERILAEHTNVTDTSDPAVDVAGPQTTLDQLGMDSLDTVAFELAVEADLDLSLAGTWQPETTVEKVLADVDLALQARGGRRHG